MAVEYLSRMESISRNRPRSTEPVSYTHLDVYKRQDLDAAHDRGDTAEVERLKKLHLKDTGEHIEPMEPIMRTMKNYMARVPLANNMDKNAPKNVPPVHMDRPFNHFLEGIPFDELIQALATTQGTKYKRAFATLNADAKYREANPNKKIRSVAGGLRDCGITLQDLMETYGRYRTASAVRIAMDRSPQIIAHAADDAQMCIRDSSRLSMQDSRSFSTPVSSVHWPSRCPRTFSDLMSSIAW